FIHGNGMRGKPVSLFEYSILQFYISGLFTDVALQCGESGQVFHCHRALLSARSSYFKVMFTADMRERSNSVIKLTGVDCGVLGALVNYVYTAQVCITESNVQSLLEAADLLQFISVKQACEEFLIRLLDVDNCLGMHAFAQLHLCPGLEREARRLILTLQRNDVLIDAVAKWVSHDLNNRVHHAADLLHSIHLNLDEIYFKTAVDVNRKCLQSREGKLKSVIIQALRSNGKEMSASRKMSSSMYIIGGYYWHPLSEVHIWDPISNTWVQGKDMPDHERESYSVSLLGANIYVTGGYRTNTVEALDTVSIYNCDYDKWTEVFEVLRSRLFSLHHTISLSTSSLYVVSIRYI
uniref:BTB domain-containing protein n=1 Tax=Monopterus albus TaxID=43700 RepID=A0A3Q3IZR7_MONAL